MDKGYVTSYMYVSRISKHGNITEAGVFRKETPFTVFFAPLGENTGSIVIASCRLYQDNDRSNFPIQPAVWTEAQIMEIEITSDMIGKYQIFWGAGQ